MHSVKCPDILWNDFRFEFCYCNQGEISQDFLLSSRFQKKWDNLSLKARQSLLWNPRSSRMECHFLIISGMSNCMLWTKRLSLLLKVLHQLQCCLRFKILEYCKPLNMLPLTRSQILWSRNVSLEVWVFLFALIRNSWQMFSFLTPDLSEFEGQYTLLFILWQTLDAKISIQIHIMYWQTVCFTWMSFQGTHNLRSKRG